MAPSQEVTLPATRRTRKSTTGYSPSKATDKENATMELGPSGGSFATTAAASRKKLRSKSLGPGGLDALKSTSGNRRVSLAAPSRPPPRSILKPTMPVLPDIAPLKAKAKARRSTAAAGDNNTTTVALRTEEEQHTAAREREDRERAAREKEVNDHREARRKSLANRRVSFAAEATLHTFHEIEYLQDSTTSTDSTAPRRASSIPAASPAAQATPGADATDSLFNPRRSTSGGDEEAAAGQSDGQQKRRRRSSTAASTLGFRDPVPMVDDNTMASMAYDSDGDGDGVEEDDDDNVLEDVASDSDSDSDSDLGDSDEGDRTATVTVDADDMSSASIMSMSVMSMRSASPIDSTTDVDEALRLATQHAGAQADESRRQRPLDDGEEVIPSFAGWGKKANGGSAPAPARAPADEDTAMSMDIDEGMDMDMTKPMGGIIERTESRLLDEDMSMDVTRVYGGIILQPPQMRDTDSIASSPMIMSTENTVVGGDVPMELTTALGAIHQSIGQEDADAQSVDEEGLEDMSMELTTVLGGVFGRQSILGGDKGRRLSRRKSTVQDNADDEDDDAPMDMTVSVGKILGGSTEGADTASQDTGKSLTDNAPSSQTPTKTPKQAKTSPAKSASRKSLSLSAFTSKGIRRTPARGGDAESSAEKPAGKSAAKNKTPEPSTPQRSSPVRYIGSRSQSPKRKGAPEAAQETAPVAAPAAAPAETSTTPKSPRRSPAKSPGSLLGKSLFTQHPVTGVATPSVVLTPQKQGRPRQSAFVGAGPASPKITEIFNRRSSLVDAAAEFVVGSAQKDSNGRRPAVTFFEEPEVATSAPQDDHEATQNLKDLIQNLSPKKNPLKGRKSLHVGSAKGLLGKRPFELDEDEDEDEADTEARNLVKRLKGAEPSPVKNVRLQQPPSAMETIGRSSRSRRSPSGSPTPGSANDKGLSSAKDVADPEKETADDATERIHLQDFLNLANIHFMELDTTKRRATEGPGAFKEKGDGSRAATDEDGNPRDVEADALVTTLCKVPVLEMYQHACRELKNYIEEGRAIMREIEAETFEDNPPIFHEYTTATPEMRAQMDSQFKNIKIYARLQSKKQWYEWRTKLHEGLQEGMLKTKRDLERDKKVLDMLREELDAVHPPLLAECEALEKSLAELEWFAKELGGENQMEVIAARARGKKLMHTIDERKADIARLEAKTKEAKERVAAMKAQREQYLKQLEEAKRVRDERRRWSHQEVSQLKAQVNTLEKKSGWAVTGAQGTTLSLAYRREIELVFDATAFQPGAANGQIDLWYIGHTRARDPQPNTPDIEFFLQRIREHVRGLVQAETSPQQLLKIVRASWDTAKRAITQIRQLRLTFPTATFKTSDTCLAVVTDMLLVPLRTKVQVMLRLCSVQVQPRQAGSAGSAGSTPGSMAQRGLCLAVAVDTRVAYGEPFNEAKMREFLTARIGCLVVREGAPIAGKQAGANKRTAVPWADTAEELRAKLLARGRK